MRSKILLVICALAMGIFFTATASAGNEQYLGTIKNFGNAAGKKGGQYAAIPAEKILKPHSFINFRMKSGEFKYVMVHTRYNGGIWKTAFKATNLNTPIKTDDILNVVSNLNKGNPTHIIFSINGEHERYERLSAEADIYISGSPAVQHTPQPQPMYQQPQHQPNYNQPMMQGERGLGLIRNFGNGMRKQGGQYLSIPAREILIPNSAIAFQMIRGHFEFIMIHARYNGGIWQSALRVNNPNQIISTDEIAQAVARIQRGNPTHIIFSINGEHENYTRTPAEADVRIISGHMQRQQPMYQQPYQQPQQMYQHPMNTVNSLGCYRDNQTRDLDGYYFSHSAMTQDMCISECRDRGFIYAGVQFVTQCYCGNSYGKYGPADNCTMNCAGNSMQKCGGSWAQNIFQVR